MPFPALSAFDDYIAWQGRQLNANEYVGGKVLPRPFSEARDIVRKRLVAFLEAHGFVLAPPRSVLLDESVGQAFMPDIVVVLPGGSRTVHLGSLEAVLDPLAIVEIVEPHATVGELNPRWDAYRCLPSVREIVEVHLQGPFVEGYVRREDGWAVEIAGERDASIRAFGSELSLGFLYEGIEFPEPPIDPTLPQGLSPDEFLEWEGRQKFKHEYIRGRIVPLGRVRKSQTIIQMTVAQNLLMAFSEAFPDDPYRLLISGLTIVAPGSDETMFPHLTLFDREPEDRAIENDEAATNPTVVVEVTTVQDTRFDVPAWLEAYATIPSLREILIVSADERKVERRFRAGEGWDSETVREGKVPVLGRAIPLTDVYEDVEFTSPG